MQKFIFLLCIFNILGAALIPTPFITDPAVIQRAGYDTTEKYFEIKLFRSAYGIAFTKLRNTSPQGEIIIGSDCAWHRLIYVYLEEGGRQSAEWIKAYGKFGSGTGQFDEPMGLCIDTCVYNGVTDEYMVYVADKCNDRVVKLKYQVSNDTLVNSGTIGSGFEAPIDVACVIKDDGSGSYVVIIEQGNHRFSLYETHSNGSYSLIERYGALGPGVGQFNTPQGIAICKDPVATDEYYIYVADKGNNRIACLRYVPGQSISWVRDYKKMGDCGFLSVTASQYYCVYVTAYRENKIYVFTQGLTELLYEYGDANLLNGPKDVCIDWDRLGLTENWTASTGIQYFKIIPEIREFYPEPDSFDVLSDSVKINFRVDETAQYLTLMAYDKAVFHDQYYEPGRDSACWDGKTADGFLVAPGTYPIKMYCGAHLLAETQVTVRGTEVSGTVSGHWTPAGSPYVLSGSCEVPIGDSLLIDPGVLIMGRNASALLDNGFIKANGIESDSIVFTAHRKLAPPDSVYPGMWSGIGLSNSGSHLEYCKIEYAGAVNTAVSCRASPEIANCALKWSKGYGIFCDSADVLPTIDNCHFLENNAAPMRISARGIPFISGNTFENNTDSVIEIIACDINENLVWHPEKLPYRVIGSCLSLVGNAQDTIKLTVLPGVELRFAQNAIFNIGGSYPVVFDVVGKTESLVVFTSDVDTLSWKGFKFSGKTIYDTLQLNNCSIVQAGSNLAGIEIASDTGIVKIDACKIYKSKKYGLWFNDKRRCNLSITNSIFEEDSIPARCLFSGVFGFGVGNEYVNNNINKIEVNPCSLRYDMTIKPQAVPYWFKKTAARKSYEVYGDGSYFSTLSIEPGTQIEFDDSTVLRIGKSPNYRGRLICEGTESDTIRMTLSAEDRGQMTEARKRLSDHEYESRNTNTNHWRGLRFEGLEADTSKLRYTSIEYAGLDTAAIIFGDSININMTDSRIFKSKEYGIWLASPKPKDNFIISNCLFEEDSVPIRTSFNNLNGIRHCAFSNNQVNAIEVLPLSVQKNLTISFQPAPYHFLKGGEDFLLCGTSFCPTITVQAGTRLLFQDSTKLFVGWENYWGALRGRIDARGKEDSMIIFSAMDTTQHWRGIRLWSTNFSDTSWFKYCEISYGGLSKPSDQLAGNLVFHQLYYGGRFPCLVENCHILRSASFGCGNIGQNVGTASLVRDNYFAGNDSFPLVIGANDLDQSIGNSFGDNKYNGIVTGGQITHSFTLANQGVPYFIIPEQLSVGPLVCLDIEQGAILKFKEKDFQIGTNSALKAKGVVFTAYDTWWSGIGFSDNNQDTSVLDSCIIEKAKTKACYINRSNYIKITNSYIINNEKGIEFSGQQGGGKIWLSGNLIGQNNCGMSSSAWYWPPNLISVKNNDFIGNKVAMTRGGDALDADLNWWADVTGPWDPSPGAPDYNPAGRGDSIGDNIIYRPWLTAPVHPSIVTLIQPNGGETLSCETEYQIKWSRSVIPLRQELYYTTDYPEGGGDKGEFFWIFIDSVAVSETSYVWSVPMSVSSRCRVGILLYYDENPQSPSTKSQINSNVKFPISNKKTQIFTIIETELSNEHESRITNTKGEIARNDIRSLDDYEYELQPTRLRLSSTLKLGPEGSSVGHHAIMVAVDISDVNFSIGSPEYTLTININPVGQGTVTKNPDSPTSIYPAGTTVELTANANPYWRFDYWSDSLIGIQNPDTIIMNSNKVVTAHFTPTDYVLNLDSFPMYQAEEPYNEMCGPAVAQMALNYMFWNNITNPEGPLMLPEFEQDLLYTYGIAHNADPESVYFDLQGMWHTIQDKKPMPYSEYGYNFSKRHSPDQYEMLKFICQWIDYTVGTYGGHKNGYPYHVPSIIPAYGDYTNWMAIRGIHTDTVAYPMPDTLTIYGFWVNDPYPASMGGIGENSYKTAQEFVETYYDTLSIGDYHGEYVAVLEPPMSAANCRLTIAQSKPGFTASQINQLGSMANRTLIAKPMEDWIIQAAIDGVTEELIPYDKRFEELFVNTTPGKPLFVKSIKGNDYYIVPFRFNNLTPQITKDKTINEVKIATKVKTIPDLKDKSKIKPLFSNTKGVGQVEAISEAGISTQVRTMVFDKIKIDTKEEIVVVILINASDGHFKEATWTDIPVKYLPISKEQAQQIAIAVAEEMGLGINDINDLHPELIHRKSSPYYPEWRVIVGEYAIYISQDGTVSIEELSGEDKGNDGVMSNDGSAPLLYSLSIASSNPFAKNTTIFYSLAKSGHVSLKIYDINGRFVKLLVDEKKSEGIYSVTWNGCDDNNQRVAAGVYFMSLTSGNFTAVNKFILAR